jgi:hypothetical protein
MTNTQRIDMYKRKKTFINNISRAFELSESTVMSVGYEVYRKEISPDDTYFMEYLVITFVGGAKIVRIANGNSDAANFREIGKLIDGGYYDEVDFYETILENGYTKVNLED